MRDATPTLYLVSATLMALGSAGGCGFHGLEQPASVAQAITTTTTLVVEHSMKCLDLPGWASGDNINLQQYACNGGSNQTFNIAEVAGDPGYHTITTTTGGCLDVPGSSTADNVLIQQYHCTGGDNQRWRLNSIGGGAYEIRPKLAPTKCLDVWGGDTADGTPVQRSPATATAAIRRGTSRCPRRRHLLRHLHRHRASPSRPTRRA